jgi:hypothetical protein
MRYVFFLKLILSDSATHRKGPVILNTYAHYLNHVSALHYTHHNKFCEQRAYVCFVDALFRIKERG